MGLKAMLYALHESPYAGKQQLIHIAIAEAVNNDTMIGFISQEAIARAAKCSVETVRVTVKRMIGSGHLRVVEESRQHRATIYQIIIPTPEMPPEIPPDSLGSEESQPPKLAGPAPKSGRPSPQISRPSPQISLGTPVLYTRPLHPSLSPVTAPAAADEASPPVATAAPGGYPPDFIEFWQVYPRKQSKGAALEAYRKARKNVSHQHLMAAVARFANDPNLPTDRTKIPHAATWLNQRRFDDEDGYPEQQTWPAKPPSASRMFADAATALSVAEIAQ